MIPKNVMPKYIMSLFSGKVYLYFFLCRTDFRFMLQYPKFAYLTTRIRRLYMYLSFKSMIISKQQISSSDSTLPFAHLKCRFL